MRFSNRHHAVLTELTHETGCGLKDSHRNYGVQLGTECQAQPQTQRAAQCRTQHAAERANQAGTHCATRCAIDCRAERGVEVRTDSGAEFPSLGAIGRFVEPRPRRATDCRAKSLIDCHIDGRSVLGVEPRSHPRIDPPVASSSLRHSSKPSGRARSGSTSGLSHK